MISRRCKQAAKLQLRFVGPYCVTEVMPNQFVGHCFDCKNALLYPYGGAVSAMFSYAYTSVCVL